MKTRTRVIHLSLSILLAGGMLSACQNRGNGGPATPNTSTPSTSTPSNSNPDSSTPGNSSSNTSSSASSSADLESALQAVAADDASFADTESAAEGDFTTQAEGFETDGDIGITQTPTRVERIEARLGAELTDEQKARLKAAVKDKKQKVKAATKARVEAAAKKRLDMALKRKAALEASGAVTVNGDGTFTVDPAKLRAHVKGKLETARARFQAAKAKAKAKLAVRKEIAKSRVQKFRRKNHTARISDVEEITNEDGSITRIATVEFENTRTGVKRTVIHSRTHMNGKLIATHSELMTTGPNGYERNATRDVEVAEDGSRTVTTESTTSWPNGKTRTRSETRSVAADGSATGSGTVTVTMPDGTSKTYDYSVGVTASGDVVVEGDDAADSSEDSAESVEVTVIDEADSEETTVVVESEGETTESTVDEGLDADVAADTETETEAEVDDSEGAEAEAEAEAAA